MKNTSSTPRSGWLSALRKAVAVVALTGVSMGVALAAPLAGSTIGNQAAATYTDASLIVRTATSNTVITTVTQVAGVLLVTPNNVVAAPGQPVSLPHTLTNTGNGTDTFALTSALTTGTALLSAITYFPDTNCDGVADSGSPSITSIGPLVAGAKACFVAVTTVGGTAPSGATGSNIVTVTSGLLNTVTAANTDTVTVSNNAVIGVTKSMTVAAAVGPATGVNLTYTLTYTNTGNATATDVVLTDVMPAGTTYVAGSGRWSGSGATALVDTVAAAVPAAGAITYDYNVTTPGSLAVTARVGSVLANSGGTLSFTVNVPAATLPGTINNTGRFCYNNGAALVPLASTPASCVTTGNPTNVVPYVVTPTYGVIASDFFVAPNLEGAAAAAATAGNFSTTDASVANDIVTVAAAAQGGTVTFDNVVVNTGNSTDTLNISTLGSTFPAGTTFLLFKAGGLTPLTDSNGDGIVDTGPLAPGAVYHVFVTAVLPGTATLGGSVTMNATSVGDATKVNPVTDTLTAVTLNAVDLTNNTAGVVAGNGNGVNVSAAAAIVAGAITTNAVNPGGSTTFTLVVNNTSAQADTFGVTVDPASALPAGWAVNFYSTATPLNCTTLGAPMANTGVVLAGANITVCAVVTVPAGQAAIAAPGQNVVFKVASPTTLVADFKLDAVTVNTVRSIALAPNNGSQIYPGGTVVYKHTLTNTGNVTEAGLTVATAMSGTTVSWGTVLYADTNGNGVLDAADLALAAVTLAPGASITVFAKVLSPASAAAGDVNTVLLTATQPNVALINAVAAPAATTAQDVTTVIAGQIGLVKMQQVDTTCAATAAAMPAAWTNAPLTAKPGECVLYQITATNLGTAAANTLVISDATPAGTTYSCTAAGAAAAATDASVVAMTVPGVVAATATATAVAATTAVPCAAAGGSVSSGTITTLAPGTSAVMTFGVRVNP
ncbi:MAG: hypothetical protein PHU06_01295 [Gallionella sp.]|nr:hypothetical protein [Gallionella sp.]